MSPLSINTRDHEQDSRASRRTSAILGAADVANGELCGMHSKGAIIHRTVPPQSACRGKLSDFKEQSSHSTTTTFSANLEEKCLDHCLHTARDGDDSLFDRFRPAQGHPSPCQNMPPSDHFQPQHLLRAGSLCRHNVCGCDSFLLQVPDLRLVTSYTVAQVYVWPFAVRLAHSPLTVK